MNYQKKSFSVAMGSTSSDFSDRWEQTFGMKTTLSPVVDPTGQMNGAPIGDVTITSFAMKVCGQCDDDFPLDGTVTAEQRRFGEREGERGYGWYCNRCWNS